MYTSQPLHNHFVPTLGTYLDKKNIFIDFK